MKCLPASKVSTAQGRILHDSHAEILAMRCFNHFLVQECKKLVRQGSATSPYIVRQETQGQAFFIREGTKFHMYSSEAPCGDASMELTMMAQEDPTPWPTRPDLRPGQNLKGRGSFSELGIVRRKPARGDSPDTMSKSCSDKLALKQCTSLLSSTASTILSPRNAYLTTLVIPQSQLVKSAFDRSFSSKGRMEPLAREEWPGEFAFHPFHVEATHVEFKYSRRVIGEAAKGSNISSVWNPYVQETLINGVLQGWKQSNPRGASMISRASLVKDILVLQRRSGQTEREAYRDLKSSEITEEYRTVKKSVIANALVGWIPNVEDSFDLEL